MVKLVNFLLVYQRTPVFPSGVDPWLLDVSDLFKEQIKENKSITGNGNCTPLLFEKANSTKCA